MKPSVHSVVDNRMPPCYSLDMPKNFRILLAAMSPERQARIAEQAEALRKDDAARAQ